MEPVSCSFVQYLPPSSAFIEFLHVMDKVCESLQSYNPMVLLKICEKLKACEKYKIDLFTDDEIKQLNNQPNVHYFISKLTLHFTWNDHSILRRIVEFNSVAANILDNFDSRLDLFLSVTLYPIPSLSYNMLPTDTSTHTILAIRCEQELYNCTLKYVYDIRSLIMETCEITQHCFQLLAIRSDPTMLYWTIPKCVVELISNMVPQHAELLYSSGILEVMIYPNLSLATGDNVTMGSTAFLDDKHDGYQLVSFWILYSVKN